MPSTVLPIILAWLSRTLGSVLGHQRHQGHHGRKEIVSAAVTIALSLTVPQSRQRIILTEQPEYRAAGTVRKYGHKAGGISGHAPFYGETRPGKKLGQIVGGAVLFQTQLGIFPDGMGRLPHRFLNASADLFNVRFHRQISLSRSSTRPLRAPVNCPFSTVTAPLTST